MKKITKKMVNTKMSKYVYCKGKIYTQDKIIIANGLCFRFRDNECNECLGNDFIEFDNFEDLIEVRDMVRCNIGAGVIGTGVVEEIDRSSDYPIICDCFDVRVKGIVEIWKRIGNKFVRICHKENEEWKVD